MLPSTVAELTVPSSTPLTAVVGCLAACSSTLSSASSLSVQDFMAGSYREGAGRRKAHKRGRQSAAAAGGGERGGNQTAG